MRLLRFFPILLMLASMLSIVTAQTSDLFFSEYIEGSSYNKAVEIYNGTGSAVDLSLYSLELYSNGNSSPNTTLDLSGTLANGDVYIAAHASADASILAVADITSGVVNFNGDDAFALRETGVGLIDVIGQIGVDPGSAWSGSDVSTKDMTLRRKSTVCTGDGNGGDVFDPSIEWIGLPKDTFDGLGAHTASCGSGGIEVVINEILADPDAAAGDANNDGAVDAAQDEFIEIVNNATSSVDMSGWTLSDDAGVRHIFPTGSIVQAGHAAVVFGGGSPIGDFGAALVQTASSGGLGLDDSGDTITLNDGAADQDVVSYGSQASDNQSITRDPDVSGGAFVKHTTASNAAGAAFSPGTRIDGSSFFSTYIHDVQGDGAAGPMDGASGVVVEGVVTGDFQQTTQLTGFFIQEEANQYDANDLTSEGLFVYADAAIADVAVGDRVRVTGDIAEYYEKTEMTNVTAIETLGAVAVPTPVLVTLPVASVTDWEAFEGMLVSIDQILTVTGNSELVKYGELELSVNGRLFTPTNIVDPGVDANTQQDLNDRSRIRLSDGSTIVDPDPVPYLDADNTRRVGSTLPSLTGALDFSFSNYEIQPTMNIAFSDDNPRSAAPAGVSGPLTVSSFNVLNFFNGDGQGGGFPTSRGADTYDEFLRQRAKIVSAIIAINADIFGLLEIENDGFGVNSAIQDLVNAVNRELGAASYSFIDIGLPQVGTDAITCALLYKPAAVTPVGAAAVLDDAVDPTFVIGNRPSIAQTFKDGDNEIFTIVINHFRSKGSACSGDPDIGDGQGNCNQTRVAAANALTNWLAGDPTSSNDPDFLLMGDLNSYAREDPVTAIKNAGYIDLVQEFVGVNAYSYVYDNQSGYLDHALASSSIHASVTGGTIWHINADEFAELDYNDTNPPVFYESSPYRSSDHDPVIVSLNLEKPVSVDMTTFQAHASNDGVLLEWSTANEIGVCGFDVFRRNKSDADYIKTNVDLISAQGGVTNENYEFFDAQGKPSSEYKLFEYFVDGSHAAYGPITVLGTANIALRGQPACYALYQNFPNPFNPTTSIRFDVPRPSEIDIGVYDITGRLVRQLEKGRFAPGAYTRIWDGRDNRGESLPSGLYFVKFITREFSKTQKMTLLQ